MALRPCSTLLSVAGSAVVAAATKPRSLGVSFEGNIGVGKSTILEVLRRHPLLQGKTEIFPEPLDQWQNVGGTGLNMLDTFYRDPHRNAYLFQNYVFLTRFVQHSRSATRESAAALRLLERCVFTDRCVFAATAIEGGLFTPLEAAAYNAWYDPVVSALPNLVPDAFVYLRADPDVCHQRLKARARSEEGGVDFEYLRALHTKHERWFIDGMMRSQQWDPPTTSSAGNEGSGVLGSPMGLRGTLNGLKTHPAIHGRPCLVVDWSSHLDFKDNQRANKEPIIEAIAVFLAELIAGAGDGTSAIHSSSSSSTLLEGKQPAAIS